MTEIWEFRCFRRYKALLIQIGPVPPKNKIFWIGRKIRINILITLEKDLAKLVKIWLNGSKIKCSRSIKICFKTIREFSLGIKLYFWVLITCRNRSKGARHLWEFYGTCTIFNYCTNVFKARLVCKIARELLSFFPPTYSLKLSLGLGLSGV